MNHVVKSLDIIGFCHYHHSNEPRWDTEMRRSKLKDDDNSG